MVGSRRTSCWFRISRWGACPLPRGLQALSPARARLPPRSHGQRLLALFPRFGTPPLPRARFVARGEARPPDEGLGGRPGLARLALGAVRHAGSCVRFHGPAGKALNVTPRRPLRNSTASARVARTCQRTVQASPTRISITLQRRWVIDPGESVSGRVSRWIALVFPLAGCKGVRKSTGVPMAVSEARVVRAARELSSGRGRGSEAPRLH